MSARSLDPTVENDYPATCERVGCEATFYLVPERRFPFLCLDHAADERRTLDGYRLTESDETTVSVAIRTTVDGWRATGWTGGRKVEALDSLVRVAAHPIGCALGDLREIEVAWITERAWAEIA